MRRSAVACMGLIGIVLSMSIAKAQPMSPDPLAPGGTSIGGTTDMPVKGPADGEVLQAESAAASTRAAGVALEQPINPAQYVCGPGDTFELNFWGQQNFRLRISADLEGRTFISKVGFVGVNGKTLEAVRADIRKKVRSVYPGLQFDITLVSPRTFMVHLAGNVKSPGAHTATPLDRVAMVLERAGGVSGSRRRITIKRKSGAQVVADLVLYEQTANVDLNPFLLDGDVITVPFPDVSVTIAGAVRRPGRYELVATKDLAELLDLAGGLAGDASRTLPLQLVRRNASEQETSRDIKLGGDEQPAVALKDEDRVFVRSTNDMQRSVLLLGAVSGADSVDQATTSIRLGYIEGDTVMSLIQRAGGIKTSGDLKRSYVSRNIDGKQTLIPVDLEALLVHRKLSADKPIATNDTIVVPPMRYSILVEGAVRRPGQYPYNPVFGISEYIAQAGGRTRSARDLDETRLIDVDGKTRSFSTKSKPSPGDAIIVPERTFTSPELVQLVLAGAGLILSGVAITFAVTR